ncbi:unnamed protein product [Linum tenue]|uniref:Alpha-1,6-mannosyl-glycoprotein 2-beta-N-acetylglucosaminyltransferase n=2 Tax=Linum tenue TaxID=586396 RepID=A0AAV0HH33_9ROSI|nr:unnamed protein product [Linum tenue]
MAVQGKKPRLKAGAFRRFASLVIVTVIGVLLLIVLLGTNSVSSFVSRNLNESYYTNLEPLHNISAIMARLNLPKQSELSLQLEKLNQLPPRNLDLYPKLADDHITIVLYVHNRPQYLKVVVDSLSKVVGISETLLVVSHDGYFKQMNKIVESIKFCQVKQIFAPYSPHVFYSKGFPGVSPADCKEKDNASEKGCIGNPDQYGNHRSPKIVSLKHHWWWMMNMVWDGMKETKGHSGHILFIEEDHFIFPNAYLNLKVLADLKPVKCPDCYAANLAPSDVNSRGENWNSLIAERMGNVGYSFNRTVWEKIHRKAKEFCFFDDYNWDITMWATVYPSFGGPVYSLRGPRTSAVHFGKCGLHQGHGEKEKKSGCIDNGAMNIVAEETDKAVNVNKEWEVRVYENQPGYQAGFKGWGGWGDERDRELCMKFAEMYH